jgi:CrcB protein
MPIWLAVAAGGALGSVARWKTAQWVAAFWPNFPWGVLIVNVSGSFLIGLIWAYADARPVPEWVRLGLMTGVLGGFTTFSAFSLDTLQLWKSAPAAAALNVVGSVGLSLLACALGMWLARQAVAA